jgi:undecaprenyl diphosphate synthase
VNTDSKIGKGLKNGEPPEHIAIIMDGNGRWASKRFLTRNAGHRAGAEALRKLSERMNGQFKYLTVYALSTENWSRPADEVSGLMALLGDYIQQYIDDSKKNNMRINVIGELSRLEARLREKILYLMDLTKEHAGMCVNIAINYGGRDEIVRAVRRACADVLDGRILPEAIDQTRFSAYLDTEGIPDPDLVIRTSCEMRLSNFLTWQSAYAEFYSSPKLLPDFSYDDLMEAVEVYMKRERRFGGRK